MKLGSAEDLLRFLDKYKVEGATGTYAFTPDKNRYSWASVANPIITGARSHVIPLLEIAPNEEIASGKFTETVLRSYLQPQGLFEGIGEIVLYPANMQSVTFGGPVLQTVFKVVNEKKGIVMIHPSMTREGGRQTELTEVEPAIARYPDIIFQFHPVSTISLVSQLMDKYPNVYYSMDAPGWIVGNGLMYPGNAADNTAESFLASVNRIGRDRIVNESVKNIIPWFQRYPDRIFWGSDLGGDANWHFNDLVTDVVFGLTREVIGRLPTDIQEKYAYKNAQKVFGRFLTPKP